MFSNHKKGFKHGQITLIVILAIVIMFAFGFLMYAKSTMVNTQMNAEADKKIQEYIDANAINQYVTSCLNQVSDEVITEAMTSGGIYDFTNVSKDRYIEFYDDVYNRTVNLSIAVTPNNECPYNLSLPGDYIVYNGSDISETQDYPYRCGYTYVDNLASLYKTIKPPSNCSNKCIARDFYKYSGFFGVNNLPILCNRTGANQGGRGIKQWTCDYYDSFGTSLQENMEKEISRKINECVDFSEIIAKSPSDIRRVGNVSTVVLFKESGMNIKVIYPFTVLMNNGQPITRMVDFGVDNNIPFKEIYDYAFEMMQYEVTDPRFNMIINAGNVLSQSGPRIGTNLRLYNYDVQKIIYANITNNYTNVFRIIDKTPGHIVMTPDHSVNGLPLIMDLAVVNRRPVLDFIHSAINSSLYDIVATEGQNITINPKGYDPDDDTLQYFYSGWREDYVDYYNIADPNCPKPTSINYTINNCTIAEASYSYPHDWTKSDDYIKTNRTANYTVVEDDVGFHRVKVTVRDSKTGQEDYQLVRIFIFDTSVTCYDSDGIDLNVKGYVTDGHVVLNDSCVGSSIMEWYCLNNKTESMIIPCIGMCFDGACVPSPILDPTPRIAIVPRKVNQYVNNKGYWTIDPDGVSDPELSDLDYDILAYCQKVYPSMNIRYYQIYIQETISGWKYSLGDVYNQTITTYSYKCLT